MGDYLTIGTVLAVGGFLRRQIASLDRHLGDVDRRLSAQVTDIDRRLAMLEGRITGWQDRQHSPG